MDGYDRGKIERYLKWIVILLLLLCFKVLGWGSHLRSASDAAAEAAMGVIQFLIDSKIGQGILGFAIFPLVAVWLSWLDAKRRRKLVVGADKQCGTCKGTIALPDVFCTHCGQKQAGSVHRIFKRLGCRRGAITKIRRVPIQRCTAELRTYTTQPIGETSYS